MRGTAAASAAAAAVRLRVVDEAACVDASREAVAALLLRLLQPLLLWVWCLRLRSSSSSCCWCSSCVRVERPGASAPPTPPVRWVECRRLIAAQCHEQRRTHTERKTPNAEPNTSACPRSCLRSNQSLSVLSKDHTPATSSGGKQRGW